MSIVCMKCQALFGFLKLQQNCHLQILVVLSYPLVKSALQKNDFLISQPKHVVGTKKNHLNDKTVLFENIYNFMLKMFI